jgi:hypothetical protein
MMSALKTLMAVWEMGKASDVSIIGEIVCIVKKTAVVWTAKK